MANPCNPNTACEPIDCCPPSPYAYEPTFCAVATYYFFCGPTQIGTGIIVTAEATSDVSYQDAYDTALAAAQAEAESEAECFTPIFLTSIEDVGNDVNVRADTDPAGDFTVRWWNYTTEDFNSADTATRQSDQTTKQIAVYSGDDLILLYAFSIRLTEIDFNGLDTLESINLNDNELVDIDVTDLVNIVDISLSDNNISTIDLSQNLDLLFLEISRNNFSSISTLNNVLLQRLFVGGNNLSVIATGHLPDLQNLRIQENIGITSVDLTANVNLIELLADDCSITAFDFTTNTLLQTVKVNNNTITTIDVSMLPELVDLRCKNCGLSALDIGSNPLLIFLEATDNSIIQAQINGILVDLDAAGLSNGEAHLEGGTNGAPSGAGIAAKTSVEGKGWIITNN